MNNRFPIVSLVAFVILILAAAYIATAKLPEIRKTMYGDASAQLERAYMPMAAFDKFYADAQWVATVQEMGGSGASKGKNDQRKSEEEEKAERAKEADRLYSKLNFLSDLDPNNKNLYEVGAMFISNDRPDKAIELLKKGDRLVKNPSYKFPFNQYHIINNVISMNNDEAKKANRKEMIDLLATAMDRPGAPEYVQNQWLRLRAEESGYDDNSIGRLKLWRDYYRSKVNALRGPTGNPDEKAAAGEKPTEDMASAGDSFASTERGNALLSQVMRMAQTMAVDNFKKRQEKGANVAALKDEHKKISEIFFSVAPTGHYSPESLHPYEAGDLFDVYTGTPVTPYGVDPDMLKEGRIVIYKGDFSHVTGKPRSEDYSQFKHDEFLRKANVAK